jgi:hypothetical protein
VSYAKQNFDRSIFVCARCLLRHCLRAGGSLKKNCGYGRDRLLALDENEFDQDMSGGWRALASEAGCALVAADLLHDYREAHHKDSGLLFWHEAQVRTDAGQYSQAFAGESTLMLSKG